MKKPLLILLLLSFAFIAKAQNSKKDSIFLVADQPPTFKDGDFSTYLANNIRYPVNAAINHIHGKVFVQFIIRKNGALTDATIIRSVSPEIDAEALRVVTSSPNWIPGVQNGRPVSVRYTIPIMFNITPPNVVDSSAAKTQDAISDESLLTAADPQNDPLVKQVFSAVEVEPSFPGGIEKFIEYTQKSIKKLNGDNYRGKVVITFVVEKEGSLSGIKILKSLNKGADAIAQEIIKKSPKWNPGMQNGKPVRVQYTLSVTFSSN